MTIAKRLMILVAGALIGCLFIGAAAITQTASINHSSQRISETTIPSVVTIDKILADFDSIRGLAYRHIIQADPTKTPQIEEKIFTTRKELSSAIQAYSSLSQDEKDKALFTTAKAGINAYLAEMDKALDYSRNNKMLEAGASAETLARVGDQAVQAIKANVEYNIRLSNENRASVSSAITNARLIIGATIIVMIALLATLGTLTYRRISGSLNNARKTIQAIETSLDFTIRTDIKGSDEISETLTVFNQLLNRLQANLRTLKEGATEVEQTSTSLLSASRQVAHGSTTQSQSSSLMAASLDQMTQSISNVATRAGEASNLSKMVGGNAQNGQTAIDTAVENIHSIATAVEAAAHDIHELESRRKDISTIINVIRDVAEQTNLLALNAAIEAARAGESGRGFAVVADEVRKLAERTASSTQEISGIIQAIQLASESAVERMKSAVSQVEQGVAGAVSAQQTMHLIHDSSNQSLRLSSEISGAIREQSHAASSIATQVETFSSMAKENSTAASHAASISEQLTHVAVKMNKIVGAYTL